MCRLSKTLIEREQDETSVAIRRAVALHDQCRVDVLQYRSARLEHILAYLGEKTDPTPSIPSEVRTT